jgi:hypothetical protein
MIFDGAKSSKRAKKKEIGAKQDKGKREWWLFAPLWKPLEQVVLVLEHGRDKYDAHNWQHVKDPNGSPARLRYTDALQRHLIDHWEGVKTDEDSGLPVLAHLVCDALFVLWFDLKAQSEASSPARKGAKR